jgi:hypothetical protein
MPATHSGPRKRAAPAARTTAVAAAALLALSVCRAAPADGPYIVTAAPIAGVISPGLCVAVDSRDPHGVWWWEPGRSGCAGRSTGPRAFRGDDANVTARGSAELEARFRIQMMPASDSTEPQYTNVALVFREGRASVIGFGTSVPTTRRNNLDMPEEPRAR